MSKLRQRDSRGHLGRELAEAEVRWRDRQHPVWVSLRSTESSCEVSWDSPVGQSVLTGQRGAGSL